MKFTRYSVVFILLIAVLIIVKLLALVRPNHTSGNLEKFRKFENTGDLILTKHARCRMECRHITADEIKEILENGNENYSKSGRGAKGDQTYAIEGVSDDRQHIRIVVAEKNNKIVLITCIDLDREWPCDCN